MVSEPERDSEPSFRVTLKDTLPLPLPDAADVKLMNDPPLATLAVQAQPAWVVIVTVPSSFFLSNEKLVGFTEYVQVEAAACETVNVAPAIVSVPVRAAPVLAATSKPTDPFPLPLAPDVTVIHCTLLPAVQVQPDVVVTLTGPPRPPIDDTDWLEGEMAKEQPAACITV
jgi:hypothetical protein